MTSRDGPTNSAAGKSGRGGAGPAAAGAGVALFAGSVSSATGGLFFASALAGDIALGGVGRVADWGTAPATSQLSVAVAADDRGSAMAARLMHCDELDKQIPEHTHRHTRTRCFPAAPPTRKIAGPPCYPRGCLRPGTPHPQKYSQPVFALVGHVWLTLSLIALQRHKVKPGAPPPPAQLPQQGLALAGMGGHCWTLALGRQCLSPEPHRTAMPVPAAHWTAMPVPEAHVPAMPDTQQRPAGRRRLSPELSFNGQCCPSMPLPGGACPNTGALVFLRTTDCDVVPPPCAATASLCTSVSSASPGTRYA